MGGLFERPAVAAADFAFEQVAFDHPLWVLFSSGTTGLPKPIMHGHGGILLEMNKSLHLIWTSSGRACIFLHHHRLDDVELPEPARC